ncbi:MAG: hypothetical protein QOF06_1153 [Solirubrobacterales bacterium]|jgi:hypothetical protein|nr:hypothetical protein [Solirubrobacterales bacterium]
MSVRVPLASVALLCGAMLFANSADASNDPLGGGSTRLTLDKGFDRVLAANGVTVSAKAGARRHGRSLLLPVAGGSLDPTLGRGAIESGGALILRHGRRRVVVRKIEMRTKREPLIATVGGNQLKLARAGRLSFERDGFGSVLTAGPLRLTAKFATRLGKKLRLRGVFEEGQRLGTMRSAAQPLTVTLQPAGAATIDIAPAFLSKLDGLFVAVNPIAPAERFGASFSFPIVAGGAISPDASLGTLRTGGDIEFLQLGGGQVFWHEPWLDLGARSDSAETDIQPSPPYPGKLGRVPLLDLGPGTVVSEPTARTISLAGAQLTLQAATAAAFNQTFAEGKAVFEAGEAVGTFSFTAEGQ